MFWSFIYEATGGSGLNFKVQCFHWITHMPTRALCHQCNCSSVTGLHDTNITHFYSAVARKTQVFNCRVRGLRSVDHFDHGSLRHRVRQSPTSYLPQRQDVLRRQPITHNKALTSWLTWQLSRNSCLVVTGHTTGEWRNSVCAHMCVSVSVGVCVCVALYESLGQRCVCIG